MNCSPPSSSSSSSFALKHIRISINADLAWITVNYISGNVSVYDDYRRKTQTLQIASNVTGLDAMLIDFLTTKLNVT